MDLRRTLLIYGIGAGLLMVGTLFYVVWYNSGHPTPTDSEAATVLDNAIQAISIEKPFTYELLSFENADQTSISGVLWCVRINPAVPFQPVPSNPSNAADHFLIRYTYDGEWSTTKFDSRLLYEGFWKQYGCGDW